MFRSRQLRRVGLTLGAGVLALAGTAPAAHAQSTSCDVAGCADFVTTYDPDGKGSTTPVTWPHPDLAANVDYYLDVKTGGPPSLLPKPGYDLKVKVQGLSAEKPKITISKVAPTAALPLRAEVAAQDAGTGKWTSLGYDALQTATGAASSAPATFVADVDTSNRDGNALTNQARVVATVTQAPASLTLLTEEFAGDPAGTRTNRSVRKMKFLSDTPSGAKVPGQVTVDLTQSAKQTRFTISRDVLTRLEYESSAPGEPLITGKVYPLQDNTTVTVTADAPGSKKLDYKADGVALVTFRSQLGSTVTNAEVQGMPSDAHLTYRTAKDAAAGTANDLITYHANGRATRVILDHSQTDVVNGASVVTTVTGDVSNLPANVGQLELRSTPQGQWVDYVSDARATSVLVEKTVGGITTRLDSKNLPMKLHFRKTGPDADTYYHYDATEYAGATSFSIAGGKATSSSIDLTSNANTAVVPKVVDVHDLTDATGRHLTYTASSVLHSAVVKSSKRFPFAEGTAVTLTGIPTSLTLDKTSGRTVESTAIGEKTTEDSRLHLFSTTGRLTKAEILITSGAPSERLAATGANGLPLDGVLVRNRPALDAKGDVMHARVSQLANLDLTSHTETTRRDYGGWETSSVASTFDLAYDALATGNAAAVDMQEQPTTSDKIQIREAALETIPRNLLLHNESKPTSKRVSYSAADVVNVRPGSQNAEAFSYYEWSKDSADAPEILRTDFSATPMPRSLQICKESANALCAQNVFDANIQKINDMQGWKCFEVCAGSPRFDPASPNKGSIRIEAWPAIDLYIGDDSGSRVDLQSVQRWVLQGHSESWSCNRWFTCSKGYLAMDTDGKPLRGMVDQGASGDRTVFDFQPDFTANDFVWAGYQMQAANGVARQGTVHCAPNTRIVTSSTTRTHQFCDGDLTG
jgi:hypothetical protein